MKHQTTKTLTSVCSQAREKKNSKNFPDVSGHTLSETILCMYDSVKWKLLNPRQEITQSTHAITLGQWQCILSFSVSVSVSFFLTVFFSHKKSQQSRAS